MSDDDEAPCETALGRIRSAILGIFSSSVRWGLCAVIFTCLSYLFISVALSQGFSDGQWVTHSRRGSYYNGGEDALQTVFCLIAAVYSWWRLFVLFKNSKES